MLRTLKNLFKQDREKFVVPKSVQNVIPIKTIWEDGIFLVGRNKYAKTFKFEDINYAVASCEDKEAMFLEYSELLNSLDSGATTKITINNRRLNKADFEQTILIPMADDGLDKYRKGVCQMSKHSGITLEYDCIRIFRNFFKLQGVGCGFYSKLHIFQRIVGSKDLFYPFSVL